jgi:hypothetical protein
LEEFRGSGWRGKDCHDFDGTVYPGRKNQAGAPNPSVDYNCNGIYQVNGMDYEKLYCANSGQMGAILAGMSGWDRLRLLAASFDVLLLSSSLSSLLLLLFFFCFFFFFFFNLIYFYFCL